MWGEEVNGEIVYELHGGQADIFRSPARFKAAIAGTGGGKTAIGPLWCMQQIARVVASGRNLRREPVLGMVVAPTYQVMSRATAPTLVRMFEGTDCAGRYVETACRYYLPRSLGTVWMLSADRPTGLEGGQFDFAWLDEAGQLKYDAWIAIQGRLGQRQAPALLTTTPYSQNWLHRRFERRAIDGDADYYVRHWASNSNPAYPDDEYERARKTLSPQRFAMRYDGLFVQRAGLVYPDFDSCLQVFDPAALEGENYGGIDFGWNDPFAALVGVLDGDGLLSIWYERYRRYKTVPEHGARLPTDAIYWADPSRPDSIRELRNAGITVRGNQVVKVLDGIDAVNARIYARTLRIHPNCRALRAEAEEYTFPEKDDEFVGDKPVDGFDHALDALRYLVANVDKDVSVAA